MIPLLDRKTDTPVDYRSDPRHCRIGAASKLGRNEAEQSSTSTRRLAVPEAELRGSTSRNSTCPRFRIPATPVAVSDRNRCTMAAPKSGQMCCRTALAQKQRCTTAAKSQRDIRKSEDRAVAVEESLVETWHSSTHPRSHSPGSLPAASDRKTCTMAASLSDQTRCRSALRELETCTTAAKTQRDIHRSVDRAAEAVGSLAETWRSNTSHHLHSPATLRSLLGDRKMCTTVAHWSGQRRCTAALGPMQIDKLGAQNQRDIHTDPWAQGTR